MQRLEVSGAVRPLLWSLGVKGVTSSAPDDGRMRPKHVELRKLQ